MRAEVHAEYRDREHWWFRARRAIFARLLREAMALPRHARILDIGPGSGINLPVLAPLGTVAVLDQDAGSLRACALAGAKRLVQGDAAAPPLAPGGFDLVCALDVLEHLADDAGALAAWRQLLAPGGWLLLSVPALPILWGRQDVASGHVRRYRRSALAARLLAAGLRPVRLSYFNTLLLPPIFAVRLVMRPFLRWTSRRGASDLSLRAPALVEELLFRAFAAEAGWLARRDLPIGVSLLALARAGDGSAAPAGSAQRRDGAGSPPG